VQSSDENQSVNDILSKVQPPTDLNLKDLITSSKTLNNGNKLIYSRQEETIRKYLESVPGITVLPPITFLPKVKVLSVPSSIQSDLIQSALECDTARLLRTINRSTTKHLIFEIDPEAYKRLANSRIYLQSFDAFRVVPFYAAPICSHCLAHGHSAERCKQKSLIPEALCSKCGDGGHKSVDCKSEKARCINCVRAKRRETAHSAFDPKCPISTRYTEMRKQMTDYGL